MLCQFYRNGGDRSGSGRWRGCGDDYRANHLHYQAAKAFADAGIHIMCDKPLTNEGAEADALVSVARHTGVRTLLNMMSCFPMVRQARRLPPAS